MIIFILQMGKPRLQCELYKDIAEKVVIIQASGGLSLSFTLSILLEQKSLAWQCS